MTENSIKGKEITCTAATVYPRNMPTLSIILSGMNAEQARIASGILKGCKDLDASYGTLPTGTDSFSLQIQTQNRVSTVRLLKVIDALQTAGIEIAGGEVAAKRAICIEAVNLPVFTMPLERKPAA
jgi:hypothetical protein